MKLHLPILFSSFFFVNSEVPDDSSSVYQTPLIEYSFSNSELCIQEIIACEVDPACTSCFDDFEPEFDVRGFESCVQFLREFEQSLVDGCQKEKAMQLAVCVGNDLMYAITGEEGLCNDSFTDMPTPTPNIYEFE